MALLMGLGRTARVLLLYRALEARLRAEFSATPASEAQSLTTRIAQAAPLVWLPLSTVRRAGAPYLTRI